MSGKSIREVFEGRARELHLPVTHLTPFRELVAQVLVQERADLEKVGEPECFGLLWEGPLGDACADCQIQSACLHRFVNQTLPQALGARTSRDMAQLGGDVGVAPAALVLAWQYSQELLGVAASLPPIKRPRAAKSAAPSPEATSPPPPPSPPTLQGPPSPQASAPPAAAAAAAKKARPASPAPASAAPSTATSPSASRPSPSPPTTPSTTCAAAAAATPASSKKTKASKPAPKAKVTKGTSKAKKTPKTTASAQAPTTSSTVPPPRATRTPTTPPATASPQDDRSGWGGHTFMPRWLREREKSPLLGYLRPGQILRRVYRQQTVEVRVGEGYYEYQGRRYPTLYAVVLEATGPVEYPRGESAHSGSRKISNWSAQRFFKAALEDAIERC